MNGVVPKSAAVLMLSVVALWESRGRAEEPAELPMPPERLILQRPAWLGGSADDGDEDAARTPNKDGVPVLRPGSKATKRETLPGMYPENLGIYDGLGFWAGTADRAYVLRISGFGHLDSRYTSESADGGSEYAMFWRRARITIDGRFLGNFEYRVMFDNLIDPLQPYDFHLDWRPIHEFNVRIGGFKSPFGLERRARSYALLFIERGFPTSLAPNRELGIFTYGQTQNGFFSYELAAVSGAPDIEVDFSLSQTPDFAGRIYVQPFRLLPELTALKYFGVGFSWTLGKEFGDANDPRMTATRSQARRSRFAGQRLFQLINDDEASVVAAGQRDRQSVQAHWHHRQFNAFFEWVRSAQRVAKIDESGTLASGTIANQAWQIVGSVSLNPDDENTFFGVTPTRPFAPAKGDWGGGTVSLRYQELHIDSNAFPIFADPANSVTLARAVASSFQWHINRHLELQTDFEWIFPRGGAAGGANKATEFSAMTRIELRY